MQQDLDIRLEGQLSDRVKVNLLQNSANQVPLANRIAINYKGDEDDIVQALDLGNTSLALPGTQYVSYSGRNEGLFGVKLATRFGPLDFTALASKQEGRSERASYSGGGASRTQQMLADYDYVKGQYFLLYDPNCERSPGSRPSTGSTTRRSSSTSTTATTANDLNTLGGQAMVDPDRVLLGSRYAGTPADTAGFRGRFDLLKPGPTADYEILSDYYLFGAYAYKIIRLRQPLVANGNACLAATYKATPLDAGGQRARPRCPGGRPDRHRSGTRLRLRGAQDAARAAQQAGAAGPGQHQHVALRPRRAVRAGARAGDEELLPAERLRHRSDHVHARRSSGAATTRRENFARAGDSHVNYIEVARPRQRGRERRDGACAATTARWTARRHRRLARVVDALLRGLQERHPVLPRPAAVRAARRRGRTRTTSTA